MKNYLTKVWTAPSWRNHGLGALISRLEAFVLQLSRTPYRQVPAASTGTDRKHSIHTPSPLFFFSSGPVSPVIKPNKPLQEELPEKPVTLAIREVADGALSGSVKEEYKN